MSFPGLPALSMDVFDIGFIFDNRIGVRHTHYSGETCRDSRRGTARYRFFLFIARLAKMNMNINQTRHYQFTCRVNCRLCSFFDFADFCLLKELPETAAKVYAAYPELAGFI